MKAISDEELKHVSGLLKVLSYPTRLRLPLHLLAAESSITEMERMLETRLPSLSQHLGELRNGELVTTRRQHKAVFYELTHYRAIDLLGAASRVPNSEPVDLKLPPAPWFAIAGPFVETGSSILSRVLRRVLIFAALVPVRTVLHRLFSGCRRDVVVYR